MGRHPDGKEKDYRVTKLWEQHHEVLRMLVVGMKPKVISAITGLTEEFISNLRNSPIAIRQLEILGVGRDAETVEAAAVIARVQPRAAKLLEQVIDGTLPAAVRERIGTAQDMLSRGGNSPIQRVKSEIQHGLTEQTLNEIKQRRLEAKVAMEADFVIVEKEEKKCG